MYYNIKMWEYYNRKDDFMKEKNELLLHIYKDAEMGAYTISKLLTDLKNKDNKIKASLEDTLKEYESFKNKAKKILEKDDTEIKENGIMAKMMAGMGINKEVASDNSDSALADMLIRGISMGSIEMTKKIKAYEKEVTNEELDFATKFLKFQEKTIEIYKDYL